MPGLVNRARGRIGGRDQKISIRGKQTQVGYPLDSEQYVVLEGQARNGHPALTSQAFIVGHDEYDSP
jgi:hypothetical protein